MPSSSSVVTRSLLYGSLVAIAFFAVYGPLTRPKVPSPVTNGMAAFVPGLSIGKPVSEIKGIPSPYWVAQLGFVSDVSRPGIVQVRLLTDEKSRANTLGDRHATVDAVEIVAQPGAVEGSARIKETVARFGTRQQDGCLVPLGNAVPRRTVSYWRTKNDRGGMAVLTDYIVPDTVAQRQEREEARLRIQREAELALRGAGPVQRPPPAPKPVSLASVIFWAGRFDGSTTLRGNFIGQPCEEVSEAPGAPKALVATMAADESLFVQLGYRP